MKSLLLMGRLVFSWCKDTIKNGKKKGKTKKICNFAD
jgi:hypothetical protein